MKVSIKDIDKKTRLILEWARQLGNSRHFRHFWHAWWASSCCSQSGSGGWSYLMWRYAAAHCARSTKKRGQICSRARNKFWSLPKNFNKLKNPACFLNIYISEKSSCIAPNKQAEKSAPRQKKSNKLNPAIKSEKQSPLPKNTSFRKRA